MASPAPPSGRTPERPLNGAEDVESAQPQLPNRGRTAFGTQANALLRKNVIYQKRNWATNSCLLSVPIILVLILFAIQQVGNAVFGGSKYKCGKGPNGEEGLQYSDQTQAGRCAVPSPVEWPAFLQAPDRPYRADFAQKNGPTGSCTDSGACPLTFLYTGGNGGDTSIADRLADNLLVSYRSLPSATLSNTQLALSLLVPGTGTYTWASDFIESAFTGGNPLYILQPNCTGVPEPVLTFNTSISGEVSFQCAETQILRLDNDGAINNDLYTGYRKGNPDNKPREISVAYDFTGSTLANLNVNIWYNKTYSNDTGQAPPAMLRTPRSMNMVAQAFLRLIRPNAQIPLLFVKEMPKPSTSLELDFASILGPLFYTWIVALLFPVFLGSLVYEKQKNLRIMMKMHGLGDKAYWLITYGYFLLVSIAYLLLFIIFGSIIGLKFFRLNDYVIQLLFYLVFANFQIALSFIASTLFSNVRTATVAGYLYVFGFGLLGQFLYSFFLEDEHTSRAFVFVLQLLPSFSLYRGLYEFAQYAFIGNYQGTRGMSWKDLHDSKNGLRGVFGILTVEWLLFLLLALYLDQVVASGSGVKKHPLFFLGYGKAKQGAVTSAKSLSGRSSSRRSGSQVDVEMERPDVAEERGRVEKIKESSLDSYSIVCDNLKKVYKGQDGNPDKYAVRGFSLAVPAGECFGLLGPNGAGKTSSINMMIGFLKPTSGTAYIQGLDIRASVDEIYSHMGVCPQHDLIWDQLTGAEHLAFYGRLKNLKGQELTTAIEDSLRSVNLQNVANKPAGKYSGGMKRRLSVAISLIGDPQVVYMDEPSTGLDPASRYNLWNVIKEAKRDRAIILTTHSMEEAEVLCDRLGIFVGGQLQCIGNAKELTSRYGGVYVLTVTTPAEEEQQVERLVTSLSAKAKKVYGLAGTQKFEIPKEDVRIADVFEAMSEAKTRLTIQAWGISDTTLEDVFIKVARDAEGGSTLT